MSEREKTSNSAQNVVFEDWVKGQTRRLGGGDEADSPGLAGPLGRPPNAGDPGKGPNPEEIGKGLFEFFQALSSIAGTPKPGDFQSAKSVPDMMLKMLQPLWGYSIKLQKQWAEMTGATATGEPENMAELVKQMTKPSTRPRGRISGRS